MEKNRPMSITILGWFLIIMGGLFLINILPEMPSVSNPLPRCVIIGENSQYTLPIRSIFLFYALLFLSIVVNIVSGIGMLNGQNWARVFYTVWGIVGLVASFMLAREKMIMIPGLIFFIIVVFFLFSPHSNKYFVPRKNEI